jgi:transcriptional regulator with XRE-family HTH domain
MSLGNVIIKLRDARGIKQSTLAHGLKVSQNFLSMIELGKRNPSPNLLLSVICYCQESQVLNAKEYAVLLEEIVKTALGTETTVVNDSVTNSISVQLPNVTGLFTANLKMNQSTKVLRSDVQELLKTITDDSTFRSSCEYFAANSRRRDFLSSLIRTGKRRSVLAILEIMSDKSTALLKKVLLLGEKVFGQSGDYGLATKN